MKLRKRHPNLVCSVAIGMEHCTIHTSEPMQKYAERIGADFFQITESKRRVPHLAKYDLILMAHKMGYERFLFLDSDIYVRRGIPNIFEYYTNALFNEMEDMDKLEYWKKRMFETMKSEIDPDFNLGDPYYNTGVMVLDEKGLNKIADRIRNLSEFKIVEIYYEQHQLNLLLKQEGLPEQQLNKRWNTFGSQNDLNSPELQESYFVHVPGITVKKHRSAKLKQIVEQLP